jgi:hypothetical protein
MNAFAFDIIPDHFSHFLELAGAYGRIEGDDLLAFDMTSGSISNRDMSALTIGETIALTVTDDAPELYECLLVEWEEGEALFVPTLAANMRFLEIHMIQHDRKGRPVGDVTTWLDANGLTPETKFRQGVHTAQGEHLYTVSTITADKAKASLIRMFFDVAMTKVEADD